MSELFGKAFFALKQNLLRNNRNVICKTLDFCHGVCYTENMRNKKLIVLLTVVMVLVLIVVTCSATFLVRNVYAYSYYGNAENGTVSYDARVIEAAGIEKNSSMFFIDESGIKSRVENAFPNVRVVNVERRFPDSVTINYVVYENSFQFQKGGSYYQCYASGRIGSVTQTPTNGYFTLIPRGELNTGVGEYIQAEGGFDLRIIEALIGYLHSTGLIDRQINERIAFVDLSREGYVYIRTTAGCSIELRGGVAEFDKLMERGWSIFVDPNPESAVPTRVSGLIRVWQSQGDGKKVMSTYTAVGAEIGTDESGNKKYYSDASYYAEHYGRVA